MQDLRVSGKNEGEALWFLDTLMQVKLPANETGGAFSVLEQTAPPGSATPMHRHDNTDEYFYLLDGSVTFYTETTSTRCTAGSLVAVPKGTVHAFRVDSGAPARILVMSSPAHFEHFVKAVSRPASTPSLPPAAPPPAPEALEQLVAIGAQHDTTILGPPPAP
jgi:quercetin dioxygenase-like cupin family protein